jgi:hypothetical protein
MARAEMESAHGAPIVATGKHSAAVNVIGIKPCGCDPVCHDGDQSPCKRETGNFKTVLITGRLAAGYAAAVSCERSDSLSCCGLPNGVASRSTA